MENDPEIDAKLNETRVLTAKKSLNCCKNARRQFYIDVLDATNQTIGLYIGNSDGQKEDLALVGYYTGKLPPKGVDFEQYKINRVPAGTKPGQEVRTARGVGIAATILLFYEEIAKKPEQIELIVGVLTRYQEVLAALANNVSTRDVFTCEECIRKALLSQNNPRQTVTETIRKRI